MTFGLNHALLCIHHEKCKVHSSGSRYSRLLVKQAKRHSGRACVDCFPSSVAVIMECVPESAQYVIQYAHRWIGRDCLYSTVVAVKRMAF